MREQKPVALTQGLVLGPQALDECHEGRRTPVSTQNRATILPAEGIRWMVAHGLRKVSSMHVEQRCAWGDRD